MDSSLGRERSFTPSELVAYVPEPGPWEKLRSLAQWVSTDPTREAQAEADCSDEDLAFRVACSNREIMLRAIEDQDLETIRALVHHATAFNFRTELETFLAEIDGQGASLEACELLDHPESQSAPLRVWHL